MNKNEKNIQYKIIKSEACGHSIQYRMIKKETELEKAKVDEGFSAKEKKKARKERSEGFKPHEREKFTADGAREFKISPTQEQLKQKLKSKERPKLPSKEDLEYPMAASEEMEKCINNPECDCQKEKKKMKKSENFYIQKIQELRKATDSQLAYQRANSPSIKTAYENSLPKVNTAAQGTKLADSMGMESAQEMSKPLIQDKQPNRTPDFSPQQNKINEQNYNANVKSASNNFIGNLTRNIPAAPASDIPMAAPAPGTPGLAPTPAAANPAAANPAAANPAAANPAAANPAAANPAAAPTQKPQSFKEAFNAARQARVGGTGGDTFEWNGKKYHSFSKDDFSQGLGAKYNPAVKQGIGATPYTPPTLGQTDTSNQSKAATPAQPKMGPTPSEGQLKDQGFNKNKLSPSGGPA